MVTLDELLDSGDRQRARTRAAGQDLAKLVRVGLWSVGWLLARVLTLLFAAVAGVFFALGWLCARAVPALRWVRAAFMLGWEAGRSRGAA